MGFSLGCAPGAPVLEAAGKETAGKAFWFYRGLFPGEASDECDIGALTIRIRVLGVPHYDDSIIGPPNPIRIIKAPTLDRVLWSCDQSLT